MTNQYMVELEECEVVSKRYGRTPVRDSSPKDMAHLKFGSSSRTGTLVLGPRLNPS